MSNDRYPKRSAKLIKKKKLSNELIRIFLKLDHLKDFPAALVGRHIKLFPFNDEYMKSYTISSFNDDIISLDIHLHLKGRASIWANESKIDDRVIIWGPKKESSDPVDLESDNALLVCDLSGFSTMISLLDRFRKDAKVSLIVRAREKISLDISNNIDIQFQKTLDLDEICQKIKKYDDTFVILGIEDIKYLNSKVNCSASKIRLKAYWK